MGDIQMVERFSAYMQRVGFEDEVHAFFRKKMRTFTFSETEGEQTLENHEAFTEFMGVLEKRFKGFIADEGIDEADFQAQCLSAKGATGAAATLVHRLMALSDYDAFMDLAMGFFDAPGAGGGGGSDDDDDDGGEGIALTGRVPVPESLPSLADVESDDDY